MAGSELRPVDPARIQDKLDQMVELARGELELALMALETQAPEQAQAVMERDVGLGQLYRIVEQACLDALAGEGRSVEAREVVGCLQIAGELVRIGGHARDIAAIVLAMDSADFSGPMEKLSRMGDLVLEMLAQVGEAVTNRDLSLAQRVAAEDREVDELDEETVSSLLMTLMTAPDRSMHSTHLLWIAYHLERIGDRVGNIADRVDFMANVS
ncbi:phosphate signaling complex PhoU family protein [endosymbiont of unidentified scaly snail isolate Monju]|uniref:phosphate signaling complex PhoU family protein n=1 Tax=endosymbiont of unidentified scaly snail isolate Monju TaxID=1248727 RepID=UPI001494B869|nr:PhoU domain-containing protein [endosymbiont of unidentified scaly snail isolate Monju]